MTDLRICSIVSRDLQSEIRGDVSASWWLRNRNCSFASSWLDRRGDIDDCDNVSQSSPSALATTLEKRNRQLACFKRPKSSLLPSGLVGGCVCDGMPIRYRVLSSSILCSRKVHRLPGLSVMNVGAISRMHGGLPAKSHAMTHE